MDPRNLRTIELLALAVTAVLGVAAFALGSDMSWSIFVGSGLLTINLIGLAWLLRPLFLGSAKGPNKWICLAILPIKTILLGLALLALFHYGGLRLAGFAVGALIILVLSAIAAMAISIRTTT